MPTNDLMFPGPAALLDKANEQRAERGLPPLDVTVADVQASHDRLEAARRIGDEERRRNAARFAEARQRRDAGMRRAEVNASSWNLLADEAIDRCAAMLATFDADDVWEPEYGNLDTTFENRALGPAFQRAAKRGVIEATDQFRTSRQPQCHGMPRRVWRSLVYEAPS